MTLIQTPYNYWLFRKKVKSSESSPLLQRGQPPFQSPEREQSFAVCPASWTTLSRAWRIENTHFFDQRDRIIFFLLNDRESSFLHLNKVRGRSALSTVKKYVFSMYKQFLPNLSIHGTKLLLRPVRNSFSCRNINIALWAKANWKVPTGISELCLPFYSHPNISDGNLILVPHFNCTQIFHIDLSRPKKAYFDFPF